MNDFKDIIDTLGKLSTEQINPNSVDIDQKSPLEIVKLINNEDKKIADIVATQLEKIAETSQIFADTLKNNGRVFYIGAGTSGRLGVLDAAECPPTFGTSPHQINGIISGGYETLVLSQEGVEDQADAAIDDLKKPVITKNDFVIGIAASRRTPYTISGLQYAKTIGCKTAFIICNKWDGTDDSSFVDMLIELEVGPEVITGSTRMKSGTAQKLTLNMISTSAMVLLGKTYGNLMVDLQSTSKKLEARSRKILMDLFNLSINEADLLLRRADGLVKTAIVMHKYNCDKINSEKLLKDANGFIAKIEI